MSAYFAPRYNDVPRALWDAKYDPACGTLRYTKAFVSNCLADTYSDFVTRLVVDLARVIVPWARVGASQDTLRKFANVELPIKKFYEAARRYAQGLSPNAHPVMSFIETARLDENAFGLLGSLVNSRMGDQRLVDAYAPVALLERVYDTAALSLATPELLDAFRSGWLDSRIQYFCDVPVSNLTYSMLAGVYGRPLFVNPAASLRLSYTAKTRKMYSDALVLDRCTYFFDYVPSVELVPEFFESVPRQLVLRTCIDQINWHDFASDSRPFVYSALGGMGEHGAATPRDFAPRRELGD